METWVSIFSFGFYSGLSIFQIWILTDKYVEMCKLDFFEDGFEMLGDLDIFGTTSTSFCEMLTVKYRGLTKFWDHSGVWPKVSLVFEDF